MANGTAVIVAPGGGFRWLSINNEGWKIAKALNKQGVAAFVLKYRLNPTPPTLEGLEKSMNLYQDGGHGFGRGYPGHTTYWWFEVFTHWLDHNNFLAPVK